MKLLAVLVVALCTACGGPKSSTHTVQGEATIKVVVGVDVAVCNEVPPEQKAECIQSLLEIAKMMGEQQQQKDEPLAGFGGI